MGNESMIGKSRRFNLLPLGKNFDVGASIAAMGRCFSAEYVPVANVRQHRITPAIQGSHDINQSHPRIFRRLFHLFPLNRVNRSNM